MRNPIAIGFYPANPKELEDEVKKYLTSKKKFSALGAIVPHAGYIYSGSVAGEVFSSIETKKTNFFLLCPNHTGYGSKIALSNEDWSTPLGVVKVNKKIVENLKNIKIDEMAHKYEHSLEVQLPFLQVLYKDFTIVPMCFSHLEINEIERLADMIFDKNSFYISSSDFIHFGPMYGYVPVSGTVEKQISWVKEEDEKMIGLISKIKPYEFYDYVVGNDLTVCGYVPITLLLFVMKKIAKRGILISYKTSFEVQRSSSFVSYAGIIFE